MVVTGWYDAFEHAFGVVGMLTSYSLHASAIPVLIEIYRRRSTMKYIFLPYLLQWINSFCWVIYVFHHGIMVKLEMLASSGGGLVLSSGSLLIFWYFILNRAQRRAFDLTVLAAVIILIILAVSSFTVTPCVIDSAASTWCWWGYICVAANTCMYGGPLLAMFWSWQKRSVELIPIRFGLGSLISSFPWVLYALAAHDRAMLLPNTAGVVISLAMLLEFRLIKFLYLRSEGLIVPQPASPPSTKSELVLNPMKQALFTFFYMDMYAVIRPHVEIELSDLSRASTMSEQQEEVEKPAPTNQS